MDPEHLNAYTEMVTKWGPIAASFALMILVAAASILSTIWQSRMNQRATVDREQQTARAFDKIREEAGNREKAFIERDAERERYVREQLGSMVGDVSRIATHSAEALVKVSGSTERVETAVNRLADVVAENNRIVDRAFAGVHAHSIAIEDDGERKAS